MAFTYSYTAIPDTDVDPDSPVTTGLMTGIVHNLVHLREWIGASFFAGAVPDHNHDGINSKVITATGETLLPTHMREIHDHFSESDVDTTMWAVTGSPTLNSDKHYLVAISGQNLRSKLQWRIDQIKMIIEGRIKMAPTTTTFDAQFGIADGSVTNRARFTNPSSADKVRCQTVGSGGTQNTDVTVGGNGVDDWHLYRIDQTSSTQTVFSIDGTVVATHATAVPDAADLNVFLGGGSGTGWYDYVRAWATENPLSTA